MNMNTEREFQFTPKNFEFLRSKVLKLAGIKLADTKNVLVYSRISRLLRQHNFTSFDQYCDYLNQNAPNAESEFINAITTNFTAFMRESHHFEYLYSSLLPEIIVRNQRYKKIRIWSAGCSTGEEPYSISFVVKDVLADNLWDIKILATDIDSDALNKAELGVYSLESIEQMPDQYRTNKLRYFNLLDREKHLYSIKDEYRNIVYIKEFNLMSQEPWPMHGPFDVIFCRNVMIYFDRPAQHHVISVFANLLSINGFLILGHSESVPGNMLTQLKYIDRTIYRRVK